MSISVFAECTFFVVQIFSLGQTGQSLSNFRTAVNSAPSSFVNLQKMVLIVVVFLFLFFCFFVFFVHNFCSDFLPYCHTVHLLHPGSTVSLEVMGGAHLST